jgi:hypothetical protein
MQYQPDIKKMRNQQDKTRDRLQNRYIVSIGFNALSKHSKYIISKIIWYPIGMEILIEMNVKDITSWGVWKSTDVSIKSTASIFRVEQ